MTPATPGEHDLSRALAKLAIRECRSAERHLADTRRRHRGIHESRKAIRRLKSLLRLGEKTFGDALPPLEAAIGRLAEGLSPLRDAHVLTETARNLAGPSPSPEWQAALRTLENRREGQLVRALHDDPRFLRRRRELRALATAVAALPWHTVDAHVVEKALARSARRVEKARKRAKHAATIPHLHRWRRRVRRLRMQREIWRRVSKPIGHPAVVHGKKARAETHALAKLSDALGARQDLKALSAALSRIGAPEQIAPLRASIRAELKHLDD